MSIQKNVKRDQGEQRMIGQITIEEYIKQRDTSTVNSERCVCYKCLYWWSQRCPYGKCYDDYRAKDEPYNHMHPNESPRTGWSNWNQPEEQGHWCRGGTFYPISYCNHYVKYNGQIVEECERANIQVFQDGYMNCALKETIGCEACIAGENDSGVYNCRHMTDTGCNKLIDAKNKMLDAIAEGERIELCKEQCCMKCTRHCKYRCGEEK